MHTTYTPEALKLLLIEHDDGVLKSGDHSVGRDFCAMEFIAKIAGEPWTDSPACVHPALGAYCRVMNDAVWPSDEIRTETMLPLLAEVFGTTALVIDISRIAEWTIRIIVPIALEAAAELHLDQAHKTALRAAAKRCKAEGSLAAIDASMDAASDAARAASAASAASYAANAAIDATSYAASYAVNAARAASAASYAAKAASYAAKAASDAAKVEIYKLSIDIVIAEIKRAKESA